MIYQEVIFTESECNTIIDYKNKYTSLMVTPMSSLINNTRTVYHKENNYNGIQAELGKDWVKKYNVWDIPINDDTQWFYNRIYDWFINISGVSLDKNKSFNNEYAAHKLHEYVIGDKFDLHIDNNSTDSTIADRIWNLGIQLNSDYKGGDYICYDETNTPIYISKEVGNVLAYESNVLHQVTEITDGKRYALVIKIHSWQLLQKNKKSLI